MPAQDTTPLKDKIISTLRIEGPSLPVRIAKATNQSILFASAFLSELVAEKKVNISNMKVGSSPIYFIPEQKYKITKFSEHLKSKERDAYILLRDKKFLIDLEQEPAIRVALRAIKDFAIPFEKNNQLIWRFFTTPESEYSEPKKLEQKIEKESLVAQAVKLKLQQEEKSKEEKQINIFNKKLERPKKKTTKPLKKKSSSQNQQDKFFNIVKEYLNKKQIEIIDIIGFSKNNLTLKINKNGEKLLIAFNKKKIDEKDILNAYKKYEQYKLNYIILLLGEPSKKIQNLINAIKSLDNLEIIE